MATDNTKVTKNTIEKLWTKIKNTFATKSEVEKIIGSQGSIQSGVGGPVFAPDSDNKTTLKYESWIEKTTTKNGNPTLTYNKSLNAATASSVSEIAKKLRSELKSFSEASLIVLVNKLDDYGKPAISKPKFNTLYLAPTSESNAENVVWSEWICIDDPQKSRGYSWKKIGTIDINLAWIEDELDKIRNDKSQMYSELNNEIIELQNYIISDKFINDVFNIAPTATETENGLMSSESVQALNDLITWASEYTDVEGGGELTGTEVESIFEMYFDTSDDSDSN